MNLRMLSGVKFFELVRKKHAVFLLSSHSPEIQPICWAVPQTHQSLLKLWCVEQGRVFCFTRKGHGGSG